ncbi:hypothetical protein ACQCVB_03285 [Fictibacillus phosphorivorans]|uniref:Uncharacterized protein n=1 Tax=Fictibacillus phosphorivorans TaxID=1221500 RepID=A0A160IQ27_9BACL|nr:hypothetical protein [Fictibacillus phosphorivorans]ANC78543.1 hypothetical protein ABE65_017750 [Fictibacillus phosphorivorans]
MRVADDVFIILFPITIVLIFIIGVCLLGNGIYLIYKKVNEEEGLHRKLEGLVSIINGILADPFSRISIVILLGGLLTLSSLFFILDMLGYIEIE